MTMRIEHWRYAIPLWLRGLLRREVVDRDLDDEFRDHIERQTAANTADGMGPDEARRAALVAFGGVEQIKDESRARRRGSKLLSLVSLISIGGVTLTVSALIVVIGIMHGLQNDLREKILVASPDIRVLTFGESMGMTDWQRVLDKVKRQPGVVDVGPFVHTQAIVHAPRRKYVDGVFVKGIPGDGAATPQVTSIGLHATAGNFSFTTRDGGRRGAVLGAKLAERLAVKPGIDSIELVTTSGIDVATGQLKPLSRTFEVTGVFETGLYDYDNSYVVISLDAAQDLAQLGRSVTGLEVRTQTPWDAPVVGQRLQDSLGLPFRAVDWHQQNSSLFNALLEKFGVGAIVLLVLLVAAFNIMSTLVMVVTDKTQEIGILAAMGLRAESIRRVFFAQGVVVGVLGTCAGTVIGLAASALIGEKKLIRLDPAVYLIDHLPVAIQPLDVMVIVLASLAVAAIATIYPARQATRLHPVDPFKPSV